MRKLVVLPLVLGLLLTVGGSANAADPFTQMAAQYGVNLVWKEFPAASCGVDYAHLAQKQVKGGCINAAVPNTIYVSPGLGDRHTKFIVLTEVGRSIQQRNGQPDNLCLAKHWAVAQGAKSDPLPC